MGAAALIMGALVMIGWASPASGAKGGNSAITAAANDRANPNADDHGNGPPANGSVGNANDKNPPGQSTGDKNRGYECDDNNGVGNGNPAHTGTCSNGGPEPSGGGVSGDVTTATTVAPSVTPTTSAPPAAEVLGENLAKPEAAQPAELARTGAGLTGVLTVAGFAMVLLGLLLVAAGRRRDVVT